MDGQTHMGSSLRTPHDLALGLLELLARLLKKKISVGEEHSSIGWFCQHCKR